MKISLYAFDTVKPLEDWLQDDRCIAPKAIILARLDEGWPAQKAIATAPTANELNPAIVRTPMRRPSYGKRYAAFGQVLTSRQWAESEHCQISGNSIERANIIRIRIERMGWTPEQAISSPQTKKRGSYTEQRRIAKSRKKYRGWGEEKTLVEWAADRRCKVEGEPLQVCQRIRSRIRNAGWSVERAVETPIDKVRCKV